MYILQFHYHLHYVHACFLAWQSVMHNPHFLWELKKRLLLLASREAFQPVTGIARRLSLAVTAVPSGDAVNICVPPLCGTPYHFYLPPSCPHHHNYLLWQKCTELLPDGVCSWKSPVPDVQSSSQAQRNKCPHINGIFLWRRKYIGCSLLLLELSDCPESFFSAFLWHYLRQTLLIRCCARQRGLGQGPQGATLAAGARCGCASSPGGAVYPRGRR